MARVKVTTTTELELDVTLAAQWFCGLSDDQQAQFFIEVAAIASPWGDSQWYHVGERLRRSTDEARDMIKNLAATHNGPHLAYLP